jgi:hypothetical protein
VNATHTHAGGHFNFAADVAVSVVSGVCVKNTERGREAAHKHTYRDRERHTYTHGGTSALRRNSSSVTSRQSSVFRIERERDRERERERNGRREGEREREGER